MSLSPDDADFLFIIVGILLLGSFFAIRIFRRSDYETRTFQRRLPRHPSADNLQSPDDEEDDDEEMGRPTEPILRRVRAQVVLAMIGLAALIYIAFANMGEDAAGIPLPHSWFN